MIVLFFFFIDHQKVQQKPHHYAFTEGKGKNFKINRAMFTLRNHTGDQKQNYFL